jgi:hypothetical protein
MLRIAMAAMLAGVLALGAAAETKVSLTQTHKRVRRPAVMMNTGVVAYAVGLYEKEKRAADPEKLELIGIGLLPSKRGWSGIPGWINIEFDKQKLFPTKAKITKMESGETGIAVLELEHDKATVRMTFQAPENGDVMLVSQEIVLKKAVKLVTIRLNCYAGEFYKTAKGKGFPMGEMDTRVLTPVREIKDGRRFKIDKDKEPWLFLYDVNYDPIKAKAHGGEWTAAGLVYNPEQMKRVDILRSNGFVGVTCTLGGGEVGKTLKADFGMWKFTSSNEAGKKVMQSINVAEDKEKKE